MWATVDSGAAACKAVPLFSGECFLGRPVAGVRPGTRRHVKRRAGRKAKLDAHVEALRAHIDEHPGFDA